MPDEILAFHFMLFSRSHVWKKREFRVARWNPARFVNSHYYAVVIFGYTLLLRAVYLVSHAGFGSGMKTPSPVDWRNRQLRHEFSHVLAERSSLGLVCCLAFTRTSRGETGCGFLKVHTCLSLSLSFSHPHRNGLFHERARARIYRSFFPLANFQRVDERRKLNQSDREKKFERISSLSYSSVSRDRMWDGKIEVDDFYLVLGWTPWNTEIK